MVREIAEYSRFDVMSISNISIAGRRNYAVKRPEIIIRLSKLNAIDLDTWTSQEVEAHIQA